MAVNYQHVKRYQNLYGLDLKGNALETTVPFATDLKNIQFRKNGTIEKRRGYQAKAASNGGYGLFVYQRINPTTAVEEPIILSAGDELYRLYTATLTVTYSGLSSVAFLTVEYNTDLQEYRFQMFEGASEVLNTGLGKGFDELLPVTLSDLIALINVIPNFTASVSGTATTPAAFLGVINSHDLIASGAYRGTANYWQKVNCPVASPFSGSETNKNSADFENITSTQMRNAIFLSNGYNEVFKYDGQNLYRAGLPDVASISSALGAAGAVTGTNYVHKAQYQQIDAVGQTIEGNVNLVFTALNPTTQKMTVTVANIQANSGFNTNCAMVNGAQALKTTITVDNGSAGPHTMKVGDKAYFYDAASASYVTRNITAITSTSITIDGAAVTVADNATISNNLKIRLFRNKSSPTAPTVWYELVELPNNSFFSTQTYTDDTPDSGLLFQFVDPITDRSPPPKGRYISQFQGLMVSAGDLENPNTVSWSDFESPEYFPLPDNQFRVSNNIGDKITGIGQSNDSFIIFQGQAIYSVTGDVSEGAFRLDRLTADIGCASHASIVDIRGLLMFMSPQGPRYISGLSLPKALGAVEGNQLVSRIDPAFDQRGLPADQVFQQKRIIGLHDRQGEKYWLFIPCESTEITTGEKYANSYSICFVYDYTRDAWLKYDNINAAGGIIEFDDELYFSERRNSTVLGAVTHVLYRQHNSGTYFDYNDNTEPVSTYWKSPWEFLGEASVLKSFQAVRIFSTEQLDNQFTLTIKTERDFIEGAELSNFDLSIGSGGYGVSGYGNDPYADVQEPALMTKLNNSRLKALRIIFQNNEPLTNFALTGYELEIAAPYKQVFKQ